jgi:dynein heavy chain
MKNLGSPPAMVFTTARAVLILLGEKITLNDPDDKVWKKAVVTMNNPAKFLEVVKNYNGENIE